MPEAPGKVMAPLPKPLCIPFKLDLPTGTPKCYSLVRQILGQLRSAKSQAPAGLSLPASKQKVTVTAALRRGAGRQGRLPVLMSAVDPNLVVGRFLHRWHSLIHTQQV